MTELKDHSVDLFLTQLASIAPTPGGGGAAALMGAQAAALVSMVCQLTIGKAQYAEVHEEMQHTLQQAETLRATLTDMIKADADVFAEVMAAYGLPKQTDDEKAQRSLAIQAALKLATQIPLACASACAMTIQLSQRVAEKGNLNVISDAGVAAMAGLAGLKSAALNVYTNTGTLKDQAFVTASLTELEGLLSAAEESAAAVYQVVKNKL